MKEIQHKERKLAIGVPLSFPWVSSAFFDSFVMMEKPSNTVLIREDLGDLPSMRNRIVERARELKCTHLAMLDSDQDYPRDTLVKLLGHNVDIVGPLIPRRWPPFDLLVFRGKINEYVNVSKVEIRECIMKNTLFSVDATGTGCLLFNMEIFKHIPKPWFKVIPNPDKKHHGKIVGEDFYFCTKARKAGYEIWIDPTCQVGHLTQFNVNWNFSDLYEIIVRAKKQRGELPEIQFQDEEVEEQKTTEVVDNGD